MDKPTTMTAREYIVRTMALRMNIQSSTIDAIISHQFEQANKALKDNNTIELSGFGKFSFNTKKALKKLDKLKKKQMDLIGYSEDPNNVNHPRAKKLPIMLINVAKDLEVLETKLYGDKADVTDSGRMAQQTDPKGVLEGDNRTDL